jgi:hypothetical protein
MLMTATIYIHYAFFLSLQFNSRKTILYRLMLKVAKFFGFEFLGFILLLVLLLLLLLMMLVLLLLLLISNFQLLCLNV